MNGALDHALETPDRSLGLVAFLATVTMLFTALTAAYLVRRTAADWGPVELPRSLLPGAAVLVASSLALEAARRRNSRRLVGVSAGLGLAFLALQVVAWRSLAAAGVYLPTSPHASFFYVLSALHGLHLAGGILVLLAASTGRVGVGPASVYWHYVGGLWFYLYFLLSFF